MSGNVLPMRPAQLTPAECEKVLALYVALSVEPEIRFAPAITRAQLIYKVLAGMRASARGFNPRDEIDRNGFMEAVTLLAHDKDEAARAGWLW